MHKAKSQITHYHFDIYLYDYFLIMQTFLVDVTSWSSYHTKRQNWPLPPTHLLVVFWAWNWLITIVSCISGACHCAVCCHVTEHWRSDVSRGSHGACDVCDVLPRHVRPDTTVSHWAHSTLLNIFNSKTYPCYPYRLTASS